MLSDKRNSRRETPPKKLKQEKKIEKLEIKVYDFKTKAKAEVTNYQDYKKVIDTFLPNEKEYRKLKVSIKVNGGYGKNKETGMSSIINMTANNFRFKRLIPDILSTYD